MDAIHYVARIIVALAVVLVLVIMVERVHMVYVDQGFGEVCEVTGC